MDLKEQEAIGAAIDTHWYYVSKARMLADHVRRISPGGPLRHVLDVGAGAGWFSRWMLRNGLAERATCVDPGYPSDSDETEAGKPLAFRQKLEDPDVDLILFMDVLEHVDDDVGLLSEYLDAAPDGTPAFITVPAFEFLWSAHDEFLEHRRRYTLGRLRDCINAADARPETMHYYFGAVFPAAAAVRLLRRGKAATASDMRPAPKPVNSMLRAVCGAERSLMRLNRIAGLSVVGLCRR